MNAEFAMLGSVNPCRFWEVLLFVQFVGEQQLVAAVVAV